MYDALDTGFGTSNTPTDFRAFTKEVLEKSGVDNFKKILIGYMAVIDGVVKYLRETRTIDGGKNVIQYFEEVDKTAVELHENIKIPILANDFKNAFALGPSSKYRSLFVSCI
jgi:hypothetical protein